MKIKRKYSFTPLPRKSHLPDAGADIFLPKRFVIKPFETLTIDLDLAVAIPEGYCGIIIPRSSIAEKGLIIQTSAIDCDYTGYIHLIITNCSNNEYKFEEGDRVCSLICVSILNFYLEEVDELPKTERGNKGLGSTGH